MSRRCRDEDMDVAASSRSAASIGEMTVKEAGRRDGPRVRELIEEGKRTRIRIVRRS